MDEFVVLDGHDHEEGKVYTTCDVALEDGVAHVPAPHRQALALALFEIAAAHDCPTSVTGEYSLTRFHLVVEFRDAKQPREPACDLHERYKSPRVHVLSVARDMPAAGKYEACGWGCVVENRLSRARRVLFNAPRSKHDEHAVG